MKKTRRINNSKKSLPHVWKKWYQQGMVAQKEYPVGSLKIVAICETYLGYGQGCSTLSLGQVVINSGPGWMATEPLCAIVVKTQNGYKLGSILDKIPQNAVPVDIFYSSSNK